MLIKILMSINLSQSRYNPCFFVGADLFVLVYVDGYSRIERAQNLVASHDRLFNKHPQMFILGRHGVVARTPFISTMLPLRIVISPTAIALASRICRVTHIGDIS